MTGKNPQVPLIFHYYKNIQSSTKTSEQTMVGRADLQEFEDHLPDKDVARGFYAKYEPKEVLGRFVYIMIDHFYFLLNEIF